MRDVGIVMSGDAARTMYRVLIGFGFLFPTSFIFFRSPIFLPRMYFSRVRGIGVCFLCFGIFLHPAFLPVRVFLFSPIPLVGYFDNSGFGPRPCIFLPRNEFLLWVF